MGVESGETAMENRIVTKKGIRKDFLDEFEKDIDDHAFHIIQCVRQFQQQKLMQNSLKNGSS